jgi:2-polyprenyl-6-hydroxyphenyl methylase/3-demethylubiquinone-9 3-methyltransferase
MNSASEIEAGRRFGFGANWAHFLALLDETRIVDAEKSLRNMLSVSDLRGRRFLDIGCGSGLFSLAARRLGAQVHSFDFDLQSVACAKELKRRYFPEDGTWRIEEGSILDSGYLEHLGQFDIVYSWGVLHHTGSMWVAIENAISLVASPRGSLFIAIYNDQGWKSHVWWFVKRFYNRLPGPLRNPFVMVVSAISRSLATLKHAIESKPMVTITQGPGDRRERGMSARYDAVDWIGGFPYEFARFDVLADYFKARGFAITNFRRDESQGCNELVVQRVNGATACAE